MVDDVSNVVRMQPQIQRMQHPARARDAEVGFQMRIVVPHQRRHAIAFFHAELLQRRTQRTRPPVKIRIPMTMQRSIWQARHDLGRAIQAARTCQHVRQRQREIHHGA